MREESEGTFRLALEPLAFCRSEIDEPTKEADEFEADSKLTVKYSLRKRERWAVAGFSCEKRFWARLPLASFDNQA